MSIAPTYPDLQMSDNTCSICLENPVKYTCPACKAQTCSATCVKRHKLRSECSGLPDPSKFVPNKDLEANSALVNRDYNYLLGLERKISLAKQDIKEGAKNVFKRNANTGRPNKRPRLGDQTSDDEDKRLALVEKIFPHKPTYSIRRQNTLVVQLPVGMSRASQNKSGYDKKSGSYTWTVDWIPVTSEGKELKEFTSFRLKEGQLLKDLVPMTVLTKIFAPSEIELADFSFYLENCLKTPEVSKSLFPLDPEKSLADNLKDMVVLEFPRVFIVQGAEVWSQYIRSPKEVFVEDDSDSSGSSDGSDLSSDLSSDDDSGSLELDSDDGPEELSSKAAQMEQGEEAAAEVEADPEVGEVASAPSISNEAPPSA